MAIRLFSKYLFIIGRREVANMEVIYVALIIKGKRNYSDIPAVIKPKVKEMLVDLDLEDLIVE